jgi:hypothetical protein
MKYFISPKEVWKILWKHFTAKLPDVVVLHSQPYSSAYIIWWLGKLKTQILMFILCFQIYEVGLNIWYYLEKDMQSPLNNSRPDIWVCKVCSSGKVLLYTSWAGVFYRSQFLDHELWFTVFPPHHPTHHWQHCLPHHLPHHPTTYPTTPW